MTTDTGTKWTDDVSRAGIQATDSVDGPELAATVPTASEPQVVTANTDTPGTRSRDRRIASRVLAGVLAVLFVVGTYGITRGEPGPSGPEPFASADAVARADTTMGRVVGPARQAYERWSGCRGPCVVQLRALDRAAAKVKEAAGPILVTAGRYRNLPEKAFDDINTITTAASELHGTTADALTCYREGGGDHCYDPVLQHRADDFNTLSFSF